MTIDRARFDQGLTYEAYKDQMTRNRDRLEENEQRFAPTKEDLAALRALPRAVKVVVLAEDWCGDVIANLPVLGRLAKESGKLDVRIFLRDQNDDIMQGYLNKGQFKSIPKEENVFDIELERAVALLKEPKQFNARGALKVLGKHPADNQTVALYSGRYGPYVKHGKVNATLPDEGMITTVTLEEAVALLDAKSGKGKSKAKAKSAPASKPRAKAAAKARKK